MKRTRALWPFYLLMAMTVLEAQAGTITAAHYSMPVSRYGHFALGQPHEYARLNATLDSGPPLSLRLPENEVFEDLAPRLVQLTPEGPTELLAIVSRREDGARLVLIRPRGDQLEIRAETPAIGTPMRWLNPVGVADLDSDGAAEIAVITTPHIGGTLRVYRPQGTQLVEIAALDGFSNHILGSPELGLSLPLSIAGKTRLIVPDTTRRHLRIVGLEAGRLIEIGRCALPAPVSGAIRALNNTEISVELSSGRHTIALDPCLDKPRPTALRTGPLP